MPRAVSVEEIDDLAAADHAVIVLNEVLDNVPSRLVERTGSEWTEIRVGALDDELALSPVPADDALSAWCDEHLDDAPDGSTLVAQTAIGPMLGDLVRRYGSSAACIIDYGAPTLELAQRNRGDLVRTFSRHRTGRDPLDAPGSTDLTVEVNTDVVRHAIEGSGGTLASARQRDFLLDLGAKAELDRLDTLQHELARNGAVMDQLVARSEANDLRALLDEAGLGGFEVMIARWGT